MDLHVVDARPLKLGRRLAAAFTVAGIALSMGVTVANAASTLCVGGPGCFSTIQAAVNAAHPGDTVRVRPGTFAGGVTVPVSIRLIGAGAESTIVKGGDHGLTIGTFNIASSAEPTVAISGVTITGGLARSSPVSVPDFGIDGVQAMGGGIEIPPASDGVGATVSISNSVITANRAAPRQVFLIPISQFVPCPGDKPCAYAEATGAGIDNWGNLTLTDSIVNNNLAGFASGLTSITSDVNGVGIASHEATTLTINDSVIADNVGSAVGPNGRSVAGGAVNSRGTALSMSDDSVTNNSLSLSSSDPTSVPQDAAGGGMHLDVASTEIRGSTFSDNSLSATNSVSDSTAFSGALQSDGALTLRGDTFSDNSVTARSTAPSGSAFADSGAGEINAASTIVGTRFIGNTASATASHGTALAYAGAITIAGVDQVKLSYSAFEENRVTATAPVGPTAQGGGLANISVLIANGTSFSHNVVTTDGPNGTSQGGGIWNGLLPMGPPEVKLTLTDSDLTYNRLSADPDGSSQGGGLFTTAPVKLIDTDIRHNRPDQCFGC